MLFRAVVAARQGQDQRIAALKLAQRADVAGVVGQRIIGEGTAGDNVGTHGMIASPLPAAGATRTVLVSVCPENLAVPGSMCACR